MIIFFYGIIDSCFYIFFLIFNFEKKVNKKLIFIKEWVFLMKSKELEKLSKKV